jgi:hypothetical protein
MNYKSIQEPALYQILRHVLALSQTLLVLRHDGLTILEEVVQIIETRVYSC